MVVFYPHSVANGKVERVSQIEVACCVSHPLEIVLSCHVTEIQIMYMVFDKVQLTFKAEHSSNLLVIIVYR